MAMFVGQHQWFSVRTADDQYILCQRCHEAEVQEWRANTGAHSAYRDGYGAADPGCFCHQINETKLKNEWGLDGVDQKGFIHWNESGDVTGKGNWSFRPNTTPHAALVVACTDCHMNASAQLNNSNSAHREFYIQTKDKPEGSQNTACMACHTMIGLNITMERIASGITIVANHTGYVAPTWTVNATINQTDRMTNSTYWAPGDVPT